MKSTNKYSLSYNSINRREFIGQMTAAAGGIMLSGCSGKRPKSLPNIIMIISDDQGWGDYGFMGHPSIETPNLDKLASESVVFTRGYVTAPLCCPSLASIITGLHPHQNKVTSNDPAYKGEGNRYNPKQWPKERRLEREKIIANFQKIPALPKILENLGYKSLQTGKWWMGHHQTGGFTNGMTHGDMDRGGRHGDEGLKIGRETMQPIYDFLNNDDNQPFFLWYAPFLPHSPHNPPKRLLDKYIEKTDSIHIAKYWANCEWFDETCGELFTSLENNGQAENTIILYVCDNGWIQKPEENGYAEKSKRTPYEGGIRTPIMVKWPGHITPQKDETTLVSSIDLAPTILNACGLEPLNNMQGVNLLDTKALKNRENIFGAAFTHDAVDIDKPESSLKYSYVIEGEWKLIQPSGINDTGNEPELYNVLVDQKEEINKAAAYPEKVEHLQKQLNDWWVKAVPESQAS